MTSNMMRGGRLLWWSLALCLGLTGCWKDNANYCEGAPNNSCALLDAQAPRCTTTDDCASPTGACDVASGVCVECTDADATACAGTTPVCGDMQTCQGCTAHSDCAASNVCLPSGACAAEAEVAYVAPTGTDNALCTQTMPCTEVAKALMTNRPYVKFAGETTEQVTIANKTVTLLAAPGAKLTDTSNGTLLTISGASNVSIYDLEIGGASGAAGAGIVMPLGNTSTVRLERATVKGNANVGISMSGGTLSVTRSTIAQNTGGGLVMGAEGSIELTHNFVYRNGSDASANVGGLALQAATGSKIEFNTIIDNRARLTALGVGGMQCDTIGLTAANNLVYRNVGGADGTVQTAGSCGLGNSFVQPATVADNTPMFVSPNITPFDYHLTITTPSSIRDAAGACTGVDVDGQPRPAGAACDLGADELVP